MSISKLWTPRTAWNSIEVAGKEEARLAIENGDINENGVADGAWSKKSYKHNFNALSGVVSMHTSRPPKSVLIWNRPGAGQTTGRSQTISKSIMLEFIFRPHARKLIMVIVNNIIDKFYYIFFYGSRSSKMKYIFSR